MTVLQAAAADRSQEVGVVVFFNEGLQLEARGPT